MLPLLGDTASNLGAAMDELMRHQPLLRSSVMSALIRVSHFKDYSTLRFVSAP